MDKLTNKLQSVLADAQSLALGRDHNALEPIHLLAVVADDASGPGAQLLRKAGARMGELPVAVSRELDLLPQLKNATGEIQASAELAKLLNLADRRAQQTGDQFISLEAVLLDMFANDACRKALQAAGVVESTLASAVAEMRQGETVDDPHTRA